MNKMYRIHSLNELLRLPNTPEYIKKEVCGIMAETKEAGGFNSPLYLLDTDLGECEAFKLPLSVKKGLYVDVFDNRVFTTPDTVLIDARGRYFAPPRVMRDRIGIDGTECDEIPIEGLRGVGKWNHTQIKRL